MKLETTVGTEWEKVHPQVVEFIKVDDWHRIKVYQVTATDEKLYVPQYYMANRVVHWWHYEEGGDAWASYSLDAAIKKCRREMT